MRPTEGMRSCPAVPIAVFPGKTGHRRAAPPRAGSSRRGSATWGLLSLLLLPLFAVGGAAFFRLQIGASEPASATLETAPVRRGPLEIRVTERGTLESSQNVVVRCLVEGGGVRILRIVDEGSPVTKGQVLVELDASRHRREAQKQAIRVQSAEAQLKSAQTRLVIQKMRNESNVIGAQMRLALGQLDLRKYLEGDYVQQLERANNEVRLAEEALRVTEEACSGTLRMMNKGYGTTNEYEADQVALRKARIALEIANEKRRVLENYTHRRDTAQKEANAGRFIKELERIQMRAQTSLRQREIEVLAWQRSLALEKDRLAKLERQIAACTIVAPCDGMAVYANANPGGRNTQEPLICEGARVWELQPLLYLPDVTHMQVAARVHESKILAVQQGLPVTVHVDARGSEAFRGIVERVSAVPFSASWPNLNLKEYATVVKITEDPEKVGTLKPGLTASVEIVVERPEAVLQVPIQACVERGHHRFAWVVAGEGEPERREIETGHANDTALEVLAGLAEGEAVVLNPRSGLPHEIARIEEEYPVESGNAVCPPGSECAFPPDLDPELDGYLFEPLASPTEPAAPTSR